MVKSMQLASLVLRGIAMLFGVIVSAAIEDKARGNYDVDYQKFGFHYVRICYYSNYDACPYAIGVGVFALVVAFVFLILDILLMWKTSVKEKIGFCVTVADIAMSVLLIVLWFVSLVFLGANWSNGNVAHLEKKYDITISFTTSAARAGIAFSALSLLVWIALLVLAVLKLKSLRSDRKSPGSGEEKKTPAPV
ncbi:synaptogyrin-1-like [Oscarella lobularis]|uniref:synaptogyrin-1-like n=1 Tax=Oscarella lobularis TaxID=121494 RepID=UPI003313D480